MFQRVLLLTVLDEEFCILCYISSTRKYSVTESYFKPHKPVRMVRRIWKGTKHFGFEIYQIHIYPFVWPNISNLHCEQLSLSGSGGLASRGLVEHAGYPRI